MIALISSDTCEKSLNILRVTTGSLLTIGGWPNEEY
jgi:hypothetical protein